VNRLIQSRLVSYIALTLLPLSMATDAADYMKNSDLILPPAITKKLEYPYSQINRYPENLEEFAIVHKLASEGVAQYNYILGEIYGDHRLDKWETDYEASFYYYVRSIQLYERHAGALLGLGVLYQRGLGTTKDVKKAIELYEKAGDAGSAIAYNNLSVLYALGKEIPQDLSKAKLYTQNAAHLGDAQSIEALRNWDYYVEIWSTDDVKKLDKVTEKHRKIELQKKQSQ
jgi:TPR repeat protein